MISPSGRFSRCEAFTLKWEGLFSNNPADPGGATNEGITLSTMQAFLGRVVSIDELKNLSPDLRDKIYLGEYWNRVKGDSLPVGVDLMIFDGAVNSGVGGITKQIQETLGITVDGLFGPNTLSAILAKDPTAFLSAFALDREHFYRSLSTFATFGSGWLRRLDAAHATALGWIAQS